MGDDRLCWFSASGYVYLASLFHSSLGKTLALEHGLKDLLGNGYEGGEKSWQILRANGAMCWKATHLVSWDNQNQENERKLRGPPFVIEV